MNPLAILIIGGLAYFALRKTPAQKKAWLQEFTDKLGAADREALTRVIKVATDSEIEDMYRFHSQYKDAMSVPAGAFRDRIIAIGKKYNIYT